MLDATEYVSKKKRAKSSEKLVSEKWRLLWLCLVHMATKSISNRKNAN